MAVHQEERQGDLRRSVNHASQLDGTLGASSVAARLSPLLDRLFTNGLPVRFEMWDYSTVGPPDSAGTVILRSPNALGHLIWSPNELGFVRAFIMGEIDFEGDLFGILATLHDQSAMRSSLGPRSLLSGINAAVRLKAVGRPPKRPDEEVRLSGWRHSKARDAAAISHHYDISAEFYRLVLGPAMTYSCARFVSADMSLADAQRAKHDLVCRKLGLHERSHTRLLDVGCGWGSMAIHAASTYPTKVTAITLSPAQEKEARRRTWDAGVEREVDVRLEDYRDLRDETYDAISSIGMFEHVGAKNMNQYFSTLYSLLPPGGRLLNHAISTPGGSKIHGPTFINRYVFPDGELIDVADVVAAMERAGFEVRDVESLREYYAKTLHAWVTNLEESWEQAVALVGEARARIWRLYMAGCANGFEDGRVAIHQVLGVRPHAGGKSGMPRTRVDWR
jgi:cyclopropane-fatty-acyl-phospholipid synthase